MSKLYLLHNGVNRGEFFYDMRALAKSLIDYAAKPQEWPLERPVVSDDCLALEISEIIFDYHLELTEGKVHLEFENGILMSFRYDCPPLEQGQWISRYDRQDHYCFELHSLEKGLTKLGM